MSFHQLYQEVQGQGDRISTRWLTERVAVLSPIKRVKESWSEVVDETETRGFYIEGPLGPPIPLAAHEALIVLSREMCRGHLGGHWRRFVYTKELMHCFDEEQEKADTPDKLDVQIERFKKPGTEMPPQFAAEIKALWRATAVLCREDKRLQFKAQMVAGETTAEVVGAALSIPAQYVRILMRDDFEAAIQKVT